MFLSLFVYLQSNATKLRRDDRGASMVEYGLLIALIAVVVALAAGPLGTAIAALFTRVQGMVAGA